MKRDRLFTWIESGVIGFFLSFSALACLTTAFSMGMVDLWLLALWCLAAAGLWGFFCSRRWGLVLWLLLAMAAGFLWQKGLLLQGIESLVYKISRVYHDAYGWPIIRWSWRNVKEMELTQAFGVYMLGVVLAALTAWTVCRGQASWVAILPGIVPVAACFVVTDTLPGNGYMILFLTTVVVLLLSSLPRQTSREQGRRLAAMAAIPVLLAVGILFLAIPRQTYYHKPKAQALHDLLLGKYTLTQTVQKLAGQDIQLDHNRVDLTAVGAKRVNQIRVMEVTPRLSGGVLYLRSAALDRYTGTQWQESETALPYLYWPDQTAMISTDEVVIKTQYAHEMLYLPYYTISLDTTGMTRGIPNDKKLNEYSVTRMLAQPEIVSGRPAPQITEAQRVQIESASRLPESTKKWAGPLAQKIVGEETQVYAQAQRIGEYVKGSATYDLKTPRMGNKKDFAQWFLVESDTGYCVHFATAGAVLLKALGIPARYVTGYMVQTTAGQTTQVLTEDAHAWVEYWLPGFGWTVLECTPPAAPATQNTEATADATDPEQQLPDQTDQPVYVPDTEPAPEAVSWQWLLYLAVGMAVLAVILLQRQLRLLHRHRGRKAGDHNAQALAMWVEAERLSRYQGKEPPQRLLELAQKAKFSPYILTDGELMEFETYLQYSAEQLKKKNIFLRLWYKWVLVLY